MKPELKYSPVLNLPLYVQIESEREFMRINLKIKFLTLAIFLNIGCVNAIENAQNDFDVFCSIVEDAMVLDVKPDARLRYIYNHLDSKDVEEAFEIIFQVAPDKRYQVFKQAVEDNLGSSWECSALEEFFR